MSTLNPDTLEHSHPKITLHWLEQSRSQRMVWLLEELGVPYTIQTYQRQNMFAPDSFKKIHPLGKFPVVCVDGIVLAESGFITEYLVDRFGGWLKPGDEEEMLRYRYYLHYSEGSLFPPLLVDIVTSLTLSTVPFFLRPLATTISEKLQDVYLTPNYKIHLDFLEEQFSIPGREFIAGGNFSAADVLVGYPLQLFKGRAVAKGLFTAEKYPGVWKYLERIEGREGWRRAVVKTAALENRMNL